MLRQTSGVVQGFEAFKLDDNSFVECYQCPFETTGALERGCSVVETKVYGFKKNCQPTEAWTWICFCICFIIDKHNFENVLAPGPANTQTLPSVCEHL